MKTEAEGGLARVWEILTRKPESKGSTTIKRHDLVFILRNLATLVENGVSLQRALKTIAQEKTLARYAPILEEIRRRVETGETFSGVLASFPDTFGDLIVNQIRVGERAGTLAETLNQVTEQQEKMSHLRSLVVKKLAYPIVLSVLGSGVVAFMLIGVIPVFEETYADAGVALPFVTQLMINVGHFASTYYWMVLLGIAAIVIGVKQIRRHADLAFRM
ncbi:MAG: type II secretion system F family protein, partial [Planctomycetales bacterium]|nr:type II secretion system F family protein [Planctomycetales bacterium]